MMDLLEQLRVRLEGELPGESAHKKMMSYARKTATAVRNDRAQAKESAVTINLFLRDGNWHTVFILRQSYKGVHSNQVSFPGGRLEGSEVHREAAVRETNEEVGVAPERIEILGSLSEIYIPPSNFLVQPFVTFLEEEPTWVPQEREVKEIMTPRLDSLLDEAIIIPREIDLPHYNTTITAPTFDVSGHMVWGATAMIWREFMEVFKEI